MLYRNVLLLMNQFLMFEVNDIECIANGFDFNIVVTFAKAIEKLIKKCFLNDFFFLINIFHSMFCLKEERV